MSIARGELLQPAAPTIERYVYVRMITSQVDAKEGKLQAGDVVTIPEAKALRWVYRARIAVPATRKEYLEYASRAGNDRKGFVIPEKPAFEYVEPEYVESPTATSAEQTGAKQVADAGEPTIADKLENLTVEDAVAPEERHPDAPRQQPGVFNQAIERGPMSDPRREDRRPEKNRNR